MQALQKKRSELIAVKNSLSLGMPFAWSAAEIDAEINRLTVQIQSFEKAAVKPKQSKLTVEKIVFVQSQTISCTMRTRYTREAVEELDYLKKQQQYQETVLCRLQNDKQPFRVSELIGRTKAKLVEIESQITEAILEIEKFENGFYDDRILAEMNSNATIAQQKSLKTLQQKQAKAAVAVPAAQSETNQKRFNAQPTFSEMNREFRYYMKGFEKFPKNLLEELKKMPNNRGFLGRDGSHYYGELPAIEPYDTTILTEKRNLPDGKFEIKEYVFTPSENIVNRKTTTYRKGRRIEHREELSRTQRVKIAQ